MVAEKFTGVIDGNEKKEKEKGSLKYAQSLGNLFCFFPKFGFKILISCLYNLHWIDQ